MILLCASTCSNEFVATAGEDIGRIDEMVGGPFALVAVGEERRETGGGGAVVVLSDKGGRETGAGVASGGERWGTGGGSKGGVKRRGASSGATTVADVELAGAGETLGVKTSSVVVVPVNSSIQTDCGMEPISISILWSVLK